LKSRLTYFNMFCLTHGFSDELEARRKEYLLYKLTIDLARIGLFVATDRAIFQRRQVMQSFLRGDVGLECDLGIGDDRLLRRFVDHTVRFRLRRSFFSASSVPVDQLEARLLRAGLELCARFFQRDDIRSDAELAREHEYFYAGQRFLPSDHPVQQVSEAQVADYALLKAQVLAGNRAGVDTVLRYGHLLVNLSNGNPALGNCTVVVLTPHPDAGSALPQTRSIRL
jgi:hypothetical protein